MKINNLRILILLELTALLFSNCSTKTHESLSFYKTLSLSLNNSRSFIETKNLLLEKTFEEKLSDPQTSQQASRWYPPAKLAKTLSNHVIAYIDSLKMLIKQEAGLRIINGVETFREDDKEAVFSLFNQMGNGEKLYQVLLTFRNNLLAIDPEIMMQFKSSMDITILLSDSIKAGHKTFTETFFDNIPTVGAITVLCEFQNNVKLAENEIITFCSFKVPHIDHSYIKL